MDAERMREILSKEYGIHSDEEFNDAVSKMKGIDIGIFTLPLFGRREDGEQKDKALATA